MRRACRGRSRGAAGLWVWWQPIDGAFSAALSSVHGFKVSSSETREWGTVWFTGWWPNWNARAWTEGPLHMELIDVKAHDQFAGSRAQHRRASLALAGGVATAFRVGQLPVPICFERGEAAHLVDIDGNEYVDFALGFGPMLLGHSPTAVIDAVVAQVRKGIGFGASHRFEAELAEAVCRVVPSAKLCVFSNTGSEAVQLAIRIAREATGRRRIIKFRGHYHGWLDSVHVAVPGKPNGPGTGGQDPAAAAAVTVCEWDDLAALQAEVADDLAAIIMEPIAVNGGCFMPSQGYLEGVRAISDRCGAVLIFDEVITGFRVALGGAQARLGVTPDLTVLGKALGAGFPISAVCGRDDVMEVVASRRVAHVGTFNANPICSVAALAAVTTLENSEADIYALLEDRGQLLQDAIETGGAEAGLALQVNRVGAAAHAFVSPVPVRTISDLSHTDDDGYRLFAAALLQFGVHVIPRGLLYLSTAHSERDLDATRSAVRRAAALVAERPEVAGAATPLR